MKHDASGTSNPISALGGRKWRAYRANNALQIPSERGGMRMRVTKAMFEDLIDTCDDIGLVNPCVDLLLKREEVHSRELLEQRFLECELFKQILAGSGLEARHAIEWMRQHRATHK